MKTIKYPKQYTGVEYLGNWTGLSQGTEQQLENISDYANGIGYLGSSIVLTNVIGASASGIVSGVDFQYDKRLDASTTEDAIDGFGSVAGGAVDTEVSGALASNKWIRLVDDSSGSPLNVKNVAGLNLKVYAKNLSIEVSPPYDRVYVDPLLKKVIFPRPFYWDDCANHENITFPNIYSTVPLITQTLQSGSTFSSDSGGLFGNRYYLIHTRPVNSISFVSISPHGASVPSSKGIASFWGRATGDMETRNADTEYNAHSAFFINANTYLYFYSIGDAGSETVAYYARGYINGTLVYNEAISSAVHHFAIAYDTSETNGFGDNSTIKFYVDGVLKYSGTEVFVVNNNMKFELMSGCTLTGYLAGTPWASLENPKLWEDNLSNLAAIIAMEYNLGSGRSDGLHPIYGSTNGYKPKITTPGGVGYLYIPDAGNPAILPMPIGGNAQIPIENISDYSLGVGYFGIAHRIYDTDYTPLTQDTDFYYDEAWDGSGTHAIDKYDNGISGAFASGKVVRIVNDDSGAKNLTDATGLNLIPVCKEMSTNLFPPSTEFYIDPLRGKIALPRPVYWDDCSSIDTIASPKIYSSIPTYGNSGAYTDTAGKFGNRYVIYWPLRFASGYSLSISPFGDSTPPTKGIYSLWGYAHGGWNTHNDNTDYYGNLRMFINANTYLQFYSQGNSTAQATYYYIYAYVNGVQVYGVGTFLATRHFAIAYDTTTDNTFGDGKTIKFYVDGIEVASSTETIVANTSMRTLGEAVCFNDGSIASYALVSFDNIKIWNDELANVSDIITMESTATAADTLHPIYGSTNGYKPKISSPGGVGYNLNGGAGSLVRGVI